MSKVRSNLLLLLLITIVFAQASSMPAGQKPKFEVSARCNQIFVLLFKILFTFSVRMKREKHWIIALGWP